MKELIKISANSQFSNQERHLLLLIFPEEPDRVEISFSITRDEGGPDWTYREKEQYSEKLKNLNIKKCLRCAAPEEMRLKKGSISGPWVKGYFTNREDFLKSLKVTLMCLKEKE